jgi:hypothetical protein
MTDDLAELLRDAVADVDPTDRLVEIRARTSSAPRSAARPWFYVAGATVLATAAAVAAFAIVGNDDDPGPSHHAQETHTELVPAYFVGETPRGQRLFREFHQVSGDDPLTAALLRIQQPAADPDYTTSWREGMLLSASVHDGDTIDVEVGPVDFDASDIAAQQLVYTLQGVIGERLPVRFTHDGEPLAGAPLEARPQTRVLSQVMINDPVEGLEVTGSFTARGAANSFEATVPWRILDGHTVVLEYSAMASSGDGDRLYPWETTVDVSGLEPGTYTFVASTDDPTGGTEGPGPFTDTRTIVVR